VALRISLSHPCHRIAHATAADRPRIAQVMKPLPSGYLACPRHCLDPRKAEVRDLPVREGRFPVRAESWGESGWPPWGTDANGSACGPSAGRSTMGQRAHGSQEWRAGRKRPTRRTWTPVWPVPERRHLLSARYSAPQKPAQIGRTRPLLPTCCQGGGMKRNSDRRTQAGTTHQVKAC
jgi:hypothetical protein